MALLSPFSMVMIGLFGLSLIATLLLRLRYHAPRYPFFSWLSERARVAARITAGTCIVSFSAILIACVFGKVTVEAETTVRELSFAVDDDYYYLTENGQKCNFAYTGDDGTSILSMVPSNDAWIRHGVEEPSTGGYGFVAIRKEIHCWKLLFITLAEWADIRYELYLP